MTNVIKHVLGCPGPWVDPLTPNIGAYQVVLTKIMEEVAARADERATCSKRPAGQEGLPPAKRGHPKEDDRHDWRREGGQTSWHKRGGHGGKHDDRGGRSRGYYWRAKYQH